jgi:hypothetical protein
MQRVTLTAVAIAALGMVYGASAASPAQAATVDRSCVVDVSSAGARPHCDADRTGATGRAIANVVIEMAYQTTDFSGPVLTFTAPSGCSNTLDDVDHSVPWLPEPGILTYRTFSNCLARHYEFPNFQGRSVGWSGASTLPFPARSIQWS